MGKVSLILVIACIYSWSSTFSIRATTYLAREDVQAFYEEKVLAREQALTGFDMIVSGTEGDFDNYRIDMLNSEYRDGGFSITTIGSVGNVVTVLATGTVGRAEYSLIGDLVRTGGGAKLGALTIDGPVLNARGVGGAYGISGTDTNPDGSPGLGSSGSGVHTILSSAKIEMENGFRPELVTGGEDGAEASFTSGMEPGDTMLDDLSDTILGHCAVTPLPDACRMYSGNQTFTGNQVFGDPDHPVVMIVDGNATLRGKVSGYGILYVNGDFDTSVGTPRWEGLVYASSVGGTHELRGTPDIFGAVVLRSTKADGTPATSIKEKNEVDPLSFTVRGNPRLIYSSSALNRLSLISDKFTTLLTSAPTKIELTNVRQAAGDVIPYSVAQ